METIDLKIENKNGEIEYYSTTTEKYLDRDSQELQRFVLYENVLGMGVVFNLLEEFDNQANLKSHLKKIESDYGNVFESHN
jgi:CO dehydrogenase/acetyl-CoA synthase alpha subunit